MRVAFLGLGNMGSPMAARIKQAGFEVNLFDANQNLASEYGPEFKASAAEAIEGVDIAITMLPTSKIVADVLIGSGEGLSRAKEGLLVIDMSSSDAADTRKLGEELTARGIQVVDAPVSGGVAKAKDGTLALMVGADDDNSFEKARPILEAMSETITRVGALGTGHAAKAINNCIAAATASATCEGLILGEKFGIDRQTLLDVINSSSGSSFASNSIFEPFIIPRNYSAGFALALMAKDAGLATSLAEELGANTPVMTKAAKQWADARDALQGADFTAINDYIESKLN